jgi:hypothetical protein
MPIAKPEIAQRRAAATVAQRDRLKAQNVLETAQQSLLEAQRRFAPGRPDHALEDAQQAVTDATTGVGTARAAEASALSSLRDGIDSWLVKSVVNGAKTYFTPDEDLARLSAKNPLVLFPVRIETRFGNDDGGPVLRVRVYPDEIFLTRTSRR